MEIFWARALPPHISTAYQHNDWLTWWYVTRAVLWYSLPVLKIYVVYTVYQIYIVYSIYSARNVRCNALYIFNIDSEYNQSPITNLLSFLAYSSMYSSTYWSGDITLILHYFLDYKRNKLLKWINIKIFYCHQQKWEREKKRATGGRGSNNRKEKTKL